MRNNILLALMVCLIVSSGKIHAQSDTLPFSRIDLLDDYEAWMDTLKNSLDIIEFHIYAEHCLEVNGEFVEYFDRADEAEITVGSVIDLNPGDSTNLYYWGSALPIAGSTGGKVLASLSLPVNSHSDSIEFTSTEEADEKEGIISFINGNVDYDLVVLRLSDLKYEYRFRFTYDSYVMSDTSNAVSDTVTNPTSDPLNLSIDAPSIKFYPNPVQNYAFFETGKKLEYYEIYDNNGRKVHHEGYPPLNGDGCYKLDLRLLDPGIWIIRFRFTDHTADAAKILVK
jgi:hypothetical protein